MPQTSSMIGRQWASTVRPCKQENRLTTETTAEG